MTTAYSDASVGLAAVPPAAPAGGQLLLSGVSWGNYEKFLEAVGNRRIRLTYDRGRLEIMAPQWNHEWWAHRLDRLVLALGDELDVDVQSGGSTTFRRQDLDRGLEPDRCYYIANAHRMLGLREVDLRRDPPPDLAIEVDHRSSSLDRMGIYAALSVPELWRCDSLDLHVYHLRAGAHHAASTSLSFPGLPIAEVMPLLRETQGLSDRGLLRHFRAWVRERVASGAPMPPSSTTGPSPLAP